MSTKLAAKTVHWLTEQLDHFASKDVHAETPESATILGSKQATFAFKPVQQLAKITDFEKRISKEQGWWMKLRNINDVLAKHDSVYEKEALDPETFKIKYLK